jgi:hypothetical protein
MSTTPKELQAQQSHILGSRRLLPPSTGVEYKNRSMQWHVRSNGPTHGSNVLLHMQGATPAVVQQQTHDLPVEVSVT